MINLINDSNYFTFSDIQILNEFIIEESNISNLELHNFNASGCDRIRIKNVAFQSNNGFTIFNGVNWGDIRETFDKTTDRDTYRQLKYVNEKQGNIIEANKFYSAEMNAYRKELKDTKWSKRIQDKIIFNLNRCVSNFSQNWVLPFFWFFFNGVVAFVLINYRRIVPYFFSGLELNSNIFWKTVYEYFCFVNPFNNIPNAKNPLVWFIFKVLSVFIIYQFIVSLRRQTRR